MSGTVSIDVLICTFRRASIRDTLQSIALQDVPGHIRLRVVVADNDDTPSAQSLIADMAGGFPHPLHYLHAPARNISIARNACLDHATADWVAFIDDDETAPPGWIAALLAAAQESQTDAIFAPAIALYPQNAPGWITARDYHSNIPVRRGGQVQTGHTCNALLRWAGTAWESTRFDLARGQSGGEDTAFFFAIARQGARFEASDTAPVHEHVAPARLTFGWLFRRKLRMGQSYAVAGVTRTGRAKLALAALGKVLACTAMAMLHILSAESRNFWLLRGTLHLGVIAGVLSLPQPRAYGG
ncbi:MAG: glycosyltransferase [Rhodobacterales bacterium]